MQKPVWCPWYPRIRGFFAAATFTLALLASSTPANDGPRLAPATQASQAVSTIEIIAKGRSRSGDAIVSLGLRLDDKRFAIDLRLLEGSGPIELTTHDGKRREVGEVTGSDQTVGIAIVTPTGDSGKAEKISSWARSLEENNTVVVTMNGGDMGRQSQKVPIIRHDPYPFFGHVLTLGMERSLPLGTGIVCTEQGRLAGMLSVQETKEQRVAVMVTTDFLHGLKYPAGPVALDRWRRDAPDQSKADFLVRSGMLLIWAGKVGEGASNLHRALLQEPKDHRINLLLSRAALYCSKREEARSRAQAVATATGSAQAWAELALIFAVDKKEVQALEMAKSCVNAAPDWADAHYWLGLRLAKANQWVDAKKEFQRAAELQPDYLVAWGWIGHCCQEMQQWPEMVENGKHMIDINPQYVNGYACTAIGYFQQRKWKEARPFTEKSVAMLPTEPSYRMALGNICILTGDVAGAHREIEALKKLGAVKDVERLATRLRLAQDLQNDKVSIDKYLID